MKIIKIKSCLDCPCIIMLGSLKACNHPKVTFKLPYSGQREIKLNQEHPNFCPLEDILND